MKILTAINNPNINAKLNKDKNIEVMCKDIQYKDAIIDVLENNKNIDIIIINENLPGEIDNEKLIKKIKEKNNKIRIIYILERKNKRIEKILEKNKIKEIYLKNEIGIKKIKEIINKKNNNINIENQVEDRNNRKVITISGPPNVGKTNFIINFCQIINDKKILIIDFDLNKQNIFYFIGVRKYSKKINKTEKQDYFNNMEKIINDFSIKINKNIFLISGLDLLSDFFNKNNEKKVKDFFKRFFNQIKNKYNLILFDIGSENNSKTNNNIYENSDLNVFLLEANLIGINKFKNYIEKNNYSKNINIVINKKDKNFIDNSILKRVLDYKILGEIKYRNSYSNLLNKKFNYLNNLKNIHKKEYYKIYQKIYKENIKNKYKKLFFINSIFLKKGMKKHE